jgi:hypothetical protein
MEWRIICVSRFGECYEGDVRLGPYITLGKVTVPQPEPNGPSISYEAKHGQWTLSSKGDGRLLNKDGRNLKTHCSIAMIGRNSLNPRLQLFDPLVQNLILL